MVTRGFPLVSVTVRFPCDIFVREGKGEERGREEGPAVALKPQSPEDHDPAMPQGQGSLNTQEVPGLIGKWSRDWKLSVASTPLVNGSWN